MFGDNRKMEELLKEIKQEQHAIWMDQISILKVLNEILKVEKGILAALQAQSAGKPIALKFTLGKAVEK